MAGRLGGDEFALLLVHATEAQAHAVAEEIKQELAGITIGRAPGLGGIGASVGVASVEAGDGSEDVLVAADEEMYAQKRTR